MFVLEQVQAQVQELLKQPEPVLVHFELWPLWNRYLSYLSKTKYHSLLLFLPNRTLKLHPIPEVIFLQIQLLYEQVGNRIVIHWFWVWMLLVQIVRYEPAPLELA